MVKEKLQKRKYSRLAQCSNPQKIKVNARGCNTLHSLSHEK